MNDENDMNDEFKMPSMYELWINKPWQEEVKERFAWEMEKRTDRGEISYAKDLADLFHGSGGRVVFCDGHFWAYEKDTGCYQIFDEPELRNFLFDLHGTKAYEGRSHNLSLPKVKTIVRIMADRLLDKSFFSNRPAGLAARNAYLQLNSEGKVVAQDHSDLHRAQFALPVAYDPTINCDDTFAEIADIIGCPDCATAYFELFGVALFGLGSAYHTMGVFVGAGANGKSALVKLIQMMIPPNLRSAVPLSEFITDFHRSTIDKKLLNTCDEFPRFGDKALQFIKNIISGDDIEARKVGGNDYKISPIAQHIICTNELPNLSESNEAVRRRLLVIPFRKIIPEEKRDVNFARNFFAANAQALLVLACKGVERVKANGKIHEPNASKQEKNRWLQKGDCIRSFVNERIERTDNPQDRVGSTDLYEACISYAKENGLPPPPSVKSLSAELKAIGFRIQKSSGVMVWHGIKLKAS